MANLKMKPGAPYDGRVDGIVNIAARASLK